MCCVSIGHVFQRVYICGACHSDGSGAEDRTSTPSVHIREPFVGLSKRFKRRASGPTDSWYIQKTTVMTTFSKTGFKTLNYNSFRPHYPVSFYKILAEYVTKGQPSHLPISTAIDLGCGTGVATYPLLNLSQHAIGLDLSPSMIETANSLIDQRLAELEISDNSRIAFKVGSTEDFVNQGANDIPHESVDLITAAQCIHWFQDYDSFFESAAKLLKKGGTLAYWYYVDPIITNVYGPGISSLPEKLRRAVDLYSKYVYDDERYIGPHWEQPGRNILKYNLKEVNERIPKQLYEDVTIQRYNPDPSEPDVLPGDKDLCLIQKKVPISRFEQYLSTYSGFHNYKEATGNEENIIEKFFMELQNELGWDRETTEVDLVFNTGYTFLTKK